MSSVHLLSRPRRATSARTAGSARRTAHGARLPTCARRSCTRKHSTAEPRRRRTPVRGLMRVRRPCRTKERPVTVLLAVRCSGGGCTARRPIASAHSTAGRTPAYLRASPGAQQSRPLSHRQQRTNSHSSSQVRGPEIFGPTKHVQHGSGAEKTALVVGSGDGSGRGRRCLPALPCLVAHPPACARSPRRALIHPALTHT